MRGSNRTAPDRRQRGEDPAALQAAALVQRAYEAFNRGDFSSVIDVLCEDVDWHDTWTHRRRRGRGAVREYWRQLTSILVPRAEVLGLSAISPTQVLVDAHMLIYDTAGKLIAESDVRHSFRLREGRIARMDARAPRPGERVVTARRRGR